MIGVSKKNAFEMVKWGRVKQIHRQDLLHNDYSTERIVLYCSIAVYNFVEKIS